ncbi:MAG: hypothetical protein ABSF43_06655 [Rectinemataceae bacterium]|jgi:hypothetical protein
MRHEAALKRLDELDAGQAYGFALRRHLSHCSSCAAVAERMEAALRAYREDTRREDTRREDTRREEDTRGAEPASLVEDRVMAAVRFMPPPRQDFALRDWLFPGAVIALSMFLLPVLGKDNGLLESLFGSGYTLSLVLGVAFTAYSAFFVATHLAELQSYLEKRGLMPR